MGIRILFFIAILIWGQKNVNAQINVKVGYKIASPTFTEVDGLLSKYEPAEGETTKNFGGLSLMHGIELGLRYSFSNTSIEVGWGSVTTDKTSLSYVASADRFNSIKYNFGLSGFSLGLDNYFGSFGIGSAISRTKLDIQREVTNNELKVVGSSATLLKVHLIWKIQESDQVSLVLKPYYEFGLSDYDLTPLASDLNISDNISETPALFGVSLVFYNGRQ